MLGGGGGGAEWRKSSFASDVYWNIIAFQRKRAKMLLKDILPVSTQSFEQNTLENLQIHTHHNS